MTFRSLLAALLVITLVFASLGWLLTAKLHPELRALTELTRALRVNHDGMLELHGGLQGWLATGEPLFFDDIERGQTAIELATDDLADHTVHHPALSRALFDMRVDQQLWFDGWARPLLDTLDTTPTFSAEHLATGEELFDRYLDDHLTAIDLATTARDEALEDLGQLLLAGVVIALLACVAVGVAIVHRNRGLHAAIVEPIDELLEIVRRIGRGELHIETVVTGPQELQEIGRGLGQMTEELDRQRTTVAAERELSDRRADALAEVLGVAREVAGSLSVRYVAETVAGAAVRLSQAARVRVWVVDSDATDTLVLAVHDTDLPRGSTPSQQLDLGEDVAGRAARDARTVLGTDGVQALPLVVGGRVVGVLEVHAAEVTDTTVATALEMLGAHAGVALEAARLHRHADELAQVDPLTRLANRRRFETDLRAEEQRALRYGRPMSLIMADLDHFKHLNDTFGHQRGDEVLRLAAEALTTTVRSSDTVYRFGGEEFVVLVREGGAQAAAELAERLRLAVAQAAGQGVVTASFGVAGLSEHAVSGEGLVSAADLALYEAKAAGRDRVAVAQPVLPPLDPAIDPVASTHPGLIPTGRA